MYSLLDGVSSLGLARGLSLGTEHSHQVSVRRLERVIRELVAAKDYARVKAIIDQLCNDYAYAVHQPHARNGGLIGLAAAAIALGSVSSLRPLPMLRLFTPRTPV